MKCHKLFIECHCEFLNGLPFKILEFSCKNANCKYKIEHCNCGRKSTQLFEGVTQYLFECGCEFEYDIEVGVRKHIKFCVNFVISFRIYYCKFLSMDLMIASNNFDGHDNDIKRTSI